MWPGWETFALRGRDGKHSNTFVGLVAQSRNAGTCRLFAPDSLSMRMASIPGRGDEMARR
jgi:hypothetical protein